MRAAAPPLQLSQPPKVYPTCHIESSRVYLKPGFGNQRADIERVSVLPILKSLERPFLDSARLMGSPPLGFDMPPQHLHLFVDFVDLLCNVVGKGFHHGSILALWATASDENPPPPGGSNLVELYERLSGVGSDPSAPAPETPRSELHLDRGL